MTKVFAMPPLAEHQVPAGDGPHPEPIGESLTKTEPFPTHALPRPFANAVRAVAANKQVPEDLPALMGLAVLSTLAAHRVAISRGHGWVEPLNLYVNTVMDSGSGKTPATNDMIRPLWKLQKVMRVAHEERIDSMIDEQDFKRQEVSRNPVAANRVEDKIKELEELRKMPPKLLYGSDTTIENLSHWMSRSNGHASIIDAEGEFFGILSGRYTKGVPNLGLALKAYDADRYTVGRIGRHQDDIDRAVLTLGLSVQPSVLEDLADDVVMRERGLLARFIFAIPPSLLGTRADEGAPYDRDAMRAWENALTVIHETLPEPDQDDADFPTLELSPAARKRHIEFKAWMEPRLHPLDGDLVGLPGWAAKHVGRVLRIAGLLHLAAGLGLDQAVSEDTMKAAITIGKWAIPHAVVAFREQLDQVDVDDDRCRSVLAWIAKKQPAEFTLREVCRSFRPKWAKQGGAQVREQVLTQLAELRWVSVVERTDGAGRVGRVYVPHPKALVPQPERPPR